MTSLKVIADVRLPKPTVSYRPTSVANSIADVVELVGKLAPAARSGLADDGVHSCLEVA
jgi:hypothetical protein